MTYVKNPTVLVRPCSAQQKLLDIREKSTGRDRSHYTPPGRQLHSQSFQYFPWVNEMLKNIVANDAIEITVRQLRLVLFNIADNYGIQDALSSGGDFRKL